MSKNAAIQKQGSVTLRELSKDFISMVLMVRRGQQVESVDAFLNSIDEFFRTFEREAHIAGYTAEQAKDAQYALCAFLDESVLNTPTSNARQHIELHPLQYKYFGVHLAGEGVFDKLDTLRRDVRANVDVLEVYHLCLALGFQGKYRLDKGDELRYLTNTLGQDIARYRAALPEALAPHWQLPDQVGQMLRHEVPLWVYLVLIVLICVGVYALLNGLLGHQVDALSSVLKSLFTSS